MLREEIKHVGRAGCGRDMVDSVFSVSALVDPSPLATSAK
jgi:hypothetical protein